MTETIKQKALALVNEVRAERGDPPYISFSRSEGFTVAEEALCRAIEQHEAYKREVSDVCEGLLACTNANKRYGASLVLNRFILPKPDPLVEVLNDLYPETSGNREYANQLRAALAARGGRIVWEGE